MSKTPPPNPHPATQIVTSGRRRAWTSIPDSPGGVVSPPVWRASTHLYDDVAALKSATKSDTDNRFFYGRRGGPTQWSLADALTEMEPGAAGTMLYPSGVAAINGALLSVLNPGDVLLMTDNAYDPSRSFATGFLKRFGIETRFFDPSIGAGIADLICDRAKVILLESPGSLTFEICDIPAICAIARARGVATVLDNTWATPYFFRALAHGVDMAVLACTKYVVGHSDVMMGSVTATPGYWPKLRQTALQLGQVVSPDDAYLASRGLRTLDVRMRQHESAALTIAQWLAAQPEVAHVLHPALPDFPGHAIWQRDFSGSSGLFSFVLASTRDTARAAFIEALALFGIGYSWGGFESLALPVDPAQYRSATKWPDTGRVVRLQIGLEHVGDLVADLANGFEAYRLAG